MPLGVPWLLIRLDAGDARSIGETVRQGRVISRNCQLLLPVSRIANRMILRAATGLARLWCDRHRRPRRHMNCREPVYGPFTTGFATAGLQQAKCLLQQLA